MLNDYILVSQKQKNMKQIVNLPELKPEVMKLARRLYREILNAPGRVDDKPRTGLSLTMWTLPMSRNAFIGKVRKPSDMATILSVLKSVVSNERGDYSSMNHEDPSRMLFTGSLTIDFDGYSISCAGSGLIGFEDAAISAISLAFVTKQKVDAVLMNVWKDRDGKLPKELIKQGHYINNILRKYDSAFLN